MQVKTAKPLTISKDRPAPSRPCSHQRFTLFHKDTHARTHVVHSLCMPHAVLWASKPQLLFVNCLRTHPNSTPNAIVP